MSNKLRRQGVFVSSSGVLLYLVAVFIGYFKKRLQAIETKVVNKGINGGDGGNRTRVRKS